uniref:Uncharacterized protein n=1 Tax=Timema douglasi TaxID=61478 RepID=A0A7R8ZD24_TIMDO|nr:unnamed protein product [Timema douglasi]
MSSDEIKPRYTLLIGKPPFETSSLKETYSRIKKCDYFIPSSVKLSAPALKMITNTLQTDPRMRPTIEQLLNYDFFTSGAIKCLEGRNKTLAKSLDVVDNIVQGIQAIPGVAGQTTRTLGRFLLKCSKEDGCLPVLSGYVFLHLFGVFAALEWATEEYLRLRDMDEENTVP